MAAVVSMGLVQVPLKMYDLEMLCVCTLFYDAFLRSKNRIYSFE
jgi:hypothetical protein